MRSPGYFCLASSPPWPQGPAKLKTSNPGGTPIPQAMSQRHRQAPGKLTLQPCSHGPFTSHKKNTPKSQLVPGNIWNMEPSMLEETQWNTTQKYSESVDFFWYQASGHRSLEAIGVANIHHQQRTVVPSSICHTSTVGKELNWSERPSLEDYRMIRVLVWIKIVFPISPPGTILANPHIYRPNNQWEPWDSRQLRKSASTHQYGTCVTAQTTTEKMTLQAAEALHCSHLFGSVRKWCRPHEI